MDIFRDNMENSTANILLDGLHLPDLLDCDILTASENFFHMDRRADFNVLICVTDGAMYVTENGRDYEIPAGGLLFLRSGVLGNLPFLSNLPGVVQQMEQDPEAVLDELVPSDDKASVPPEEDAHPAGKIIVEQRGNTSQPDLGLLAAGQTAHVGGGLLHLPENALHVA